MKLIIAVVSEAITTRLLQKLSEEGFPTTKMASRGGFFKKGNATLLVDLGGEELHRCVEVMRSVVADHPSRSRDEKVADLNIFVVKMDGHRRV